jgi:hypothetical protein
MFANCGQHTAQLHQPGLDLGHRLLQLGRRRSRLGIERRNALRCVSAAACSADGSEQSSSSTNACD